MMIPTMIDGLSAVLQYTVVREDIPGLLPLSFQEKQGAMINLRTNKLHLPHLRAVVHMHRTQGEHRTIDVTIGLTPVTFRVPGEVSQQFGLSWHQFVMGGTVENSIRDGNDQLVMKDVTKVMCRVTESIQKQHRKISKPTSHFTSSHNMVTIYHQDTVTGQDNSHPHFTDSHFSQDDQGCDNSNSFSEAKVLREKALEKEEMARRMEEQKNRAFRSAPRRPRPRARVPTLEQMNGQLRNDQPNQNESGPGPTSRTPTVAASSSTNDHLEEVLKEQAQQAEFLQHMWVQQSQMQQALQQQVFALTGAIQQLAETQQVSTACTSEETRRKTSRG